MAGEKITDRLVSIADPDARPIRKGKLGKPTEFGYVAQLAEVTENTRRGARGLILPAATQLGNPAENTLLPDTAAELKRLDLAPARDRARRRLHARPDQHRARRPGARPRVHRRPPAARLPAHPTPARATASAPKAASATSNAATACAAAA